jgi:hypothetical protein
LKKKVNHIYFLFFRYFHTAVYKALGMIKEKEGNQDDIWYTMSMVSHIARGVCHNDSVCDKRDAKMMMHSTCDPMMAKACIKYGDIMSMINNVDILGWDTICQYPFYHTHCRYDRLLWLYGKPCSLCTVCHLGYLLFLLSYLMLCIQRCGNIWKTRNKYGWPFFSMSSIELFPLYQIGQDIIYLKL